MGHTLDAAVWCSWALHTDALVIALRHAGLRAAPVSDPDGIDGLLVLGASVPECVPVLESRRGGVGATVVWGGTLPPLRVAALRAAGAAAYLSMLTAPRDVARVVERVLVGEAPPWPEAPPPMSSLTRAEAAVARAYLVTWSDLPRAEVALRLGLSESTLKAHVANIRGKTGHEGTATREGLRLVLTVRGWLD